ncbi:PREDICTED: cytochrome b561 and DOMON domain-containing protein At3g61750-like [Ipomoea nil]|uniref:cytochrome b561 and DOMON domain-containing protein At3g61750-like n=1 Tax=Ipomoea nil TaxID=35883 RepID=UPI00090159F2|nr:PREDICTED: cytochrome b561 and DOMON domain-containing protein At3g61750-like [Ipomoea nil]
MGANLSFPEWQSMSSLVAFFLVIYLIGFGIENVVAEDQQHCRINNITAILPPPYGNMRNMICQNVWDSFTIRFSQSKDYVVTIVLSATYTTGWVGMGFSSDGMMINSSCMVGWIPPAGGKGQILQYHVEGTMPSEIKPNKGELPLTKTPPLAVLQNGTIYLAFQLEYPTPLGPQPVVLAYSSEYPHQDLLLTHHDDKTSIIFDFSTSKAAASASIKRMKMIHGIVGILGWGFFLPCGAMVARYLKNHNPLWFYLHICCQVTGFLLGFVTVIVGLQLYNQLDCDFPTHKGIGILLLVLSILQMFALFLRPDEDSPYRKYWKWYHSWVGRTALFFGALNIVLGMHFAEAGSTWKTSYGVIVGLTILTCIVLEVFVEQKLNDLPPPATS